MVGNNEGSLMTGVKFPNLLGRGEKLQAEYTYGTRKSSSFNISMLKPLRGKLKTNLTGNIYQSTGEYPQSGFKELDRGFLADLSFKSAPLCTSSAIQGIPWFSLKDPCCQECVLEFTFWRSNIKWPNSRNIYRSWVLVDDTPALCWVSVLSIPEWCDRYNSWDILNVIDAGRKCLTWGWSWSGVVRDISVLSSWSWWWITLLTVSCWALLFWHRVTNLINKIDFQSLIN